jgi:hypothetical protein
MYTKKIKTGTNNNTSPYVINGKLVCKLSNVDDSLIKRNYSINVNYDKALIYKKRLKNILFHRTNF